MTVTDNMTPHHDDDPLSLSIPQNVVLFYFHSTKLSYSVKVYLILCLNLFIYLQRATNNQYKSVNFKSINQPKKQSKLTSYYCRQHCGVAKVHNTAEKITQVTDSF
jgi:hypothetical protein